MRTMFVAGSLALSCCAVAAEPLRIVATDAGFEAPATAPSGLRHIVFENHGKAIHEGMLVKLPAGTTVDGYVASVKSGALFPEGALDYSGPGLTSPGERTELWTRLDPGDYIVICWNENHASTRKAHALHVDGKRVDDPAPHEDVVVKLVDFRFEISKPIGRGTQVLRIETPGPSMHEADLYRLLPGKTKDDLLAWRKADGKGTPPATALGGALDSHDITRVVWVRREFSPGRYVIHCEMPMDHAAQGGTSYATHGDAGMVREFEVE